MKKTLKWTGIVLGTLLVLGFLAFLYLIPPFTLAPPEAFSGPTASAPPSVDGIADPALRAVAERGRYMVLVHDCSGCHTPLGDEGPNWKEYLAGGNKVLYNGYGTFFTRNLTPDRATGLGRRTDEEVTRVLQSGLLPEGRVAHYRDMPWAYFSNWTMEDRYAILVYLRHLNPVYHGIPADAMTAEIEEPGANEVAFGKDFGEHAPTK